MKTYNFTLLELQMFANRIKNVVVDTLGTQGFLESDNASIGDHIDVTLEDKGKPSGLYEKYPRPKYCDAAMNVVIKKH
jgi:hypothetical protein